MRKIGGPLPRQSYLPFSILHRQSVQTSSLMGENGSTWWPSRNRLSKSTLSLTWRLLGLPNARIICCVAGLLGHELEGRVGRPATRKRGRALGSYLRQSVVLSSVAAKRRKFELLAASCLVPLSLGVSEPALAQTFTPAGNDYPGGINVSAGPAQPIS